MNVQRRKKTRKDAKRLPEKQKDPQKSKKSIIININQHFLTKNEQYSKLRHIHEGESISNQTIPFPIDRDGHDFHALFQHIFYMCLQNCTRFESIFNKILNVKHG